MSTIRAFLADESGPVMVEYGLLLGLVVIVSIALITLLGQITKSLISSAILP
jgi:Flp pilus assembly pilin Flp